MQRGRRRAGSRWSLAVAALTTAVVAAACSSTTQTNVVDAGAVCAPGDSKSCVGPAGCMGGQVCREDGSGFGSCECAAGTGGVAGTSAGGVGGAGGTAASGGTGASGGVPGTGGSAGASGASGVGGVGAAGGSAGAAATGGASGSAGATATGGTAGGGGASAAGGTGGAGGRAASGGMGGMDAGMAGSSGADASVGGSAGVAGSSGGSGMAGTAGAAGATADAGLQTVQYLAAVAECIDEPSPPDPDQCEDLESFGEMTVDGNSATGNAATSYVRFDLDGAFAGRTVESVTLELTVTDGNGDDGSSSGVIWEVTPFARADLFVSAPTRVGAMPIAGDQGAVALSQTVQWPLPTSVAAPSGSVYLGVYPVSSNGVVYYNVRGNAPPRLVIEYR